jgi:hypothetical protein
MGSIKYLSTTLKQYKECYSGLLERHKLEYADHNEFTFINSELESFWDKFIDINDIEEFPFQFKFTTGYTDEELSNALADQKEFRDIAIKSNLSSTLIIDFLETRKQELENESIFARKTNSIENIQIEFSILEWATIFYYADETKLLPDCKIKKIKREDFMKKHDIDTSYSYFKNQLAIAIKRINIESDYPTDKLEKIIPFLTNNYAQAVVKVDNDISYLQNEFLD